MIEKRYQKIDIVVFNSVSLDSNKARTKFLLCDKLDQHFYISLTLQKVVQEIAIVFLIETVFYLYYIIATNIFTVCIKK